MANKPVIIGFSTVDATTTRSITRTDVDLVNADLLNHFYTLPGENKMRPTWGCLLRKRIFEQYSTGKRDQIIADVMVVIDADPRVSLISTSISDVPYGITLDLNLNYIQLTTAATLILTFNSDTDALYGYLGSN